MLAIFDGARNLIGTTPAWTLNSGRLLCSLVVALKQCGEEGWPNISATIQTLIDRFQNKPFKIDSTAAARASADFYFGCHCLQADEIKASQFKLPDSSKSVQSLISFGATSSLSGTAGCKCRMSKHMQTSLVACGGTKIHDICGKAFRAVYPLALEIEDLDKKAELKLGKVEVGAVYFLPIVLGNVKAKEEQWEHWHSLSVMGRWLSRLGVKILGDFFQCCRVSNMVSALQLKVTALKEKYKQPARVSKKAQQQLVTDIQDVWHCVGVTVASVLYFKESIQQEKAFQDCKKIMSDLQPEVTALFESYQSLTASELDQFAKDFDTLCVCVALLYSSKEPQPSKDSLHLKDVLPSDDMVKDVKKHSCLASGQKCSLARRLVWTEGPSEDLVIFSAQREEHKLLLGQGNTNIVEPVVTRSHKRPFSPPPSASARKLKIPKQSPTNKQ